MIGAKLKQARLAKGYTQAALGNVVGVTQQAIASWEKGRRIPDSVTLAKLATTLGISADNLLDSAEAAQQEHDLLFELFQDNPRILAAVKSITFDGKIKDGEKKLILSDTSKAFIKQAILLALKEAKDKQTGTVKKDIGNKED